MVLKLASVKSGEARLHRIEEKGTREQWLPQRVNGGAGAYIKLGLCLNQNVHFNSKREEKVL
jgi:hypothetical protein